MKYLSKTTETLIKLYSNEVPTHHWRKQIIFTPLLLISINISTLKFHYIPRHSLLYDLLLHYIFRKTCSWILIREQIISSQFSFFWESSFQLIIWTSSQITLNDSIVNSTDLIAAKNSKIQWKIPDNDVRFVNKSFFSMKRLNQFTYSTEWFNCDFNWSDYIS